MNIQKPENDRDRQVQRKDTENRTCGERTARLTIRGTQTDPDGNSQEHTSVYLARYTVAEEGPGHVFRYLIGGDDTGGPESVLFVSRGLVRMERAGEGSSVMIFDPSVPMTGCDYGTPFGVIPMEIRTQRISVMDGGASLRPAAGSGRLRLRARVQYSLGMDADYALECSVTIQADEITAGG